MSDPYTVLGVTPQATEEEITKAYRNLARKYHPDTHPGDKEAEAKMKEINAAYEQIKDIREGKTTYAPGGTAGNRSDDYWKNQTYTYYGPFYSGYQRQTYQNRRASGNGYSTNWMRIVFRIIGFLLVLRLLSGLFGCMLSGLRFLNPFAYIEENEREEKGTDWAERTGVDDASLL